MIGDRDEVDAGPRVLRTSDGHVVGLLIPVGPAVADGEIRRYLTPPEWPLQVLAIEAPAGYTGGPHVHDPLPAKSWPTRHSVLLVQSGSARIRLFDADGRPAGQVTADQGTAVVCLEGHQVLTTGSAARVLEIKQGPYPGNEAADRRPIDPIVDPEVSSL